MIVKRYTGSDLDHMHRAIQEEMGDGAVIVHTQKQGKRRLLGFGGTQYEVTAVAEDANLPSPPSAPPVPDSLVNDLLEQQKLHYRGIRQALRRLDERLDEVDERIGDGRGNDQDLAKARSCLVNVHDAWLPSLTRSVRASAGADQPSVEDWRNALREQLPVSPGLPFGPARTGAGPSVCVFVGPTGVGKTTTLAKLASRCVLNQKLKVGMVTLDTFRLGAVEQLREYARLLGVELAVAFSPGELRRHVAAFADRDVVLVDTPGRSQFDIEGIREIQRALDGLPRVDVLLHVTAGERACAAETIVHNYRPLRPTAIVLTKLDEAACCDGLTRLLDKTDGVPVAYLTDGQRVPEDIHEADPERLAELIIPAALAFSA